MITSSYFSKCYMILSTGSVIEKVYCLGGCDGKAAKGEGMSSKNENSGEHQELHVGSVKSCQKEKPKLFITLRIIMTNIEDLALPKELFLGGFDPK